MVKTSVFFNGLWLDFQGLPAHTSRFLFVSPASPRGQAVRGSANKSKFSQAVEEYLARYEVDETAAAGLRSIFPLM